MSPSLGLVIRLMRESTAALREANTSDAIRLLELAKAAGDLLQSDEKDGPEFRSALAEMTCAVDSLEKHVERQENLCRD